MSDTNPAGFRTGKNYVVTDARVAPHHFTPGEHVRFVRAAAYPGRYLFRRTATPASAATVQWLAAEDVADPDRATHRAHRGFTEGRTTGPGGLPEVAWFCHECMTGGRDA